MEQAAQKNPPKKSSLLWIAVLIIALAAGVAVYFIVTSGQENKETNTNTAAVNGTAASNVTAKADPYAALQAYNGKVVTIASTDGKVSGRMAIYFNLAEQMPIQVVYFLKVKDALPKKASSLGGELYNYIANHDQASEIRQGEGTGVLSAAFCNLDQTPDVLAIAQSGDYNVTTYGGCSAQYEVGASTDTFFHIYVDYYNSYTFNYSLLKAKDTFAIFDASPFYTPNAETGFDLDEARVIQEGTISAQYALTYSE